MSAFAVIGCVFVGLTGFCCTLMLIWMLLCQLLGHDQVDVALYEITQADAGAFEPFWEPISAEAHIIGAEAECWLSRVAR